MSNPIYYKTLKVQFAFLISPDGKVKQQMLHPLELEKQFKSEAEAKKYVKSLKEIL